MPPRRSKRPRPSAPARTAQATPEQTSDRSMSRSSEQGQSDNESDHSEYGGKKGHRKNRRKLDDGGDQQGRGQEQDDAMSDKSSSVDGPKNGKGKRTRASDVKNRPSRPQTSNSDSTIQRGGPAANEVYNSFELRDRILSHLDLSTLATLARVEKGITAFTARHLYHTIPANIVPRMSRKAGRRVVYCDAVRVIDRTFQHVPTPDNPTHGRRTARPKQSEKLDHVELLKSVSIYLKKCPNLRRVECEFPGHKFDPTYVLHIVPNPEGNLDKDGRDYTLELDLVEHIRLVNSSLKDDGKVSFPKPPKFAGIDTVRHSMILFWEHCSYGDRNAFPYDPSALAVRKQQWRTWLGSDDCDPRITGIDLDEYNPLRLRSDEVVDWALERAHRQPPIPFTHLSGEVEMSAQTPFGTFIENVITCFGSTLRTLAISRDYGYGVEEPHGRDVIKLVDLYRLINTHAPRLTHLRLEASYEYLVQYELSLLERLDRHTGHAGLRIFRVFWRSCVNAEKDQNFRNPYKLVGQRRISAKNMAHAMAPFGSNRCHHSTVGYHGNSTDSETFNHYIRLYQTHGPDRDSLLAGRIQDVRSLAFSEPDGSRLIGDKDRETMLRNIKKAATMADAMLASASSDYERYMTSLKGWQSSLHAIKDLLQDPPRGSASNTDGPNGTSVDNLARVGAAWIALRHGADNTISFTHKLNERACGVQGEYAKLTKGQVGLVNMIRDKERSIALSKAANGD